MFHQSLNVSLTDPQVLDFIKSVKTDTQWKFWQTYNAEEIYNEIDDFCFYDIANLNALCRDGSYEFYLKDYLRNRKLRFENKQIPHTIPEFSDITENTYGLILYQQQVEEIIIRLTKCNQEFARKVRKGYGKKKVSEMAENNEIIQIEAYKNGFGKTIINNTLDIFDNKISYCFDRYYAYYRSLKIYMDALYQLHFPDFVKIEKEDQNEFLKNLIDVSKDFYTFRNDVIEKFGEFYANQTDMFFERAIKMAEKDLPHSAIMEALFALSLQEYQDKTGITYLLGFLAQLHIDINKYTKAKGFLELGRKMLDPDDPDFVEDAKIFDNLDDIIRSEEWKNDPDE